MKKAWLLGLLGLAWTAFSSYWYVCKKCGCCGDATAVTAPALDADPFKFSSFGKADFSETNGFAAWKTATLASSGIGDTLVIYGHYGQNEPGGEALGLQRAEALKAKLAGAFDASRIVCRAKMEPALTAQSFPNRAASVDWLKARIDMNRSTIIEQGSEAIILFPFRSAVKDVDAKVDAFLKSLVEKHKNDAAAFTITGHTDDVGDEGPNLKLGQARADFIASFLKRGGIASSRISTVSKGETEPIAPNTTDEGRHKNRRVVISVKP